MITYRNILFKKYNNPYMKQYDKCVKELKTKLLVKINYSRVLSQLKQLNWIQVHSDKNYKTNVTQLFDDTELVLTKKLEKYKNKIRNIENKINNNKINKSKMLDKFNKTCPICYITDLESYAITRCGHIFCHNCIKKCIAMQFKCPLCRTVIFFKDVMFFNSTEYLLNSQYKIKSNQILDYSINMDNNLLYIPPNSSVLVRNGKNESIMINLKNITSTTDQYDFEDYIDYTEFRKLISNIEQNVKLSYDNKVSKMVSLLIYIMRSRRELSPNINNIPTLQPNPLLPLDNL